MKVIDILNKIANGEEVPKKIVYDNKEFEFDILEKQYTSHNEDYSINNDLTYYIDEIKCDTLHEEIEIIEKPKKIEKFTTKYNCSELDFDMIDKLNEVIDKINEMEN